MTRREAIAAVLVMAVAMAACHRRRHPPSDGPVPSTPGDQSPPAVPATPDICGSPCCGGAACPVTTLNAGHAGCAPGAASCNACQSGVTCVPGNCSSMLTSGESWSLHVSYLAGGDVPDMCASERRNAWACLRRSAFGTSPAGEWGCLPMSEPCTSQTGQGASSVRVATEDLTIRGLDIEIRAGGPSGALLAERAGARYTTGLLRQALCSGLKFDKLRDVSGSGIAVFAYFLEPPT